MDVDALGAEIERQRSRSRGILAVVATAGSTATGSFDDLDAIGRLCEAHGLWLHVDGAHGASALFSDAHRHRLAGIERARSIAWDPHKMMLMPLSASVVLVRDERDLEAAFSQKAPYLFHRNGRGWDQGVRSFQCSRRLDAVKVWVALQRHGAAGIGALYDRLCETARRAPPGGRAAGRSSRPSTSPSRTSSASAGAATAVSTTRLSTASTCACARPTTARARAGSPRPSPAAAASCAAR